MPADEQPPAGRINLAEPGSRPARSRMGRWLRGGLVMLLIGSAAAGGFLLRRPIADGVGKAAGAVWDTWSEWSSALRRTAADIPEQPATTTTTVPEPQPAPSRSVLLVVGDGVGSAAFALLVQPPLGDAELIMIPQTLLVQVPGFGEFSMAEALAFGGPRLAGLALSNEMGIRIDDLAPLPAGEMPAIGDGIVVDVPVELFVEEADGSRRFIAAGQQRLSADLVGLLLVEQGTGGQFDWLRRQEAVWSGVLAAVAGDPAIGERLTAGAGDPSSGAALLAEIAAAPSIGAPPVDRVALSASRDAMVLATDRIDRYLSEHLAHLALGEGRRPRVEILNGNGRAGSGVGVAETLVGAGFYVFRSGNADRFDYATSQVIAQGEDAVAAAVAAGEVLGVPDVVLEARAPSGVVDVSIIVGADLASRED
ncbi:MAG: LCP family protein [Actinomycetota bacterium]